MNYRNENVRKFSSDFFVMVNNARRLSTPDDQILLSC